MAILAAAATATPAFLAAAADFNAEPASVDDAASLSAGEAIAAQAGP